MIILGIDPGTKNCGYSVLEKLGSSPSAPKKLLEAGLIKITKDKLEYQITQLCEGIDLIFNSYKIDEVAIEDIFYAYNPQTVLKLAQFRGALLLKIMQLHGSFTAYTPLQVKKAVTGNGKAAKEQVSFMVRKMLGINKEIKPLDITDAIAIALAHSFAVR